MLQQEEEKVLGGSLRSKEIPRHLPIQVCGSALRLASSLKVRSILFSRLLLIRHWIHIDVSMNSLMKWGQVLLSCSQLLFGPKAIYLALRISSTWESEIQIIPRTDSLLWLALFSRRVKKLGPCFTSTRLTTSSATTRALINSVFRDVWPVNKKF